jgi:hypothetical protein
LVVSKVPIAGFLPSVVIVIAITIFTITVFAIMALAFVAAAPVNILFLATVGTAAGLDPLWRIVAQRLISVARETGPAMSIQSQVLTRLPAAAPPGCAGTILSLGGRNHAQDHHSNCNSH